MAWEPIPRSVAAVEVGVEVGVEVEVERSYSTVTDFARFLG
jgi:hypothetical protein